MSSFKASYSQQFIHEGVDLRPIEHSVYILDGIRDQWTKSLLEMPATKSVMVNGNLFTGQGDIFVREAYITQSSIQVLVDYSWKSGSTFGIGGARHRLIKYTMDWYVSIESTGDEQDAPIQEPVMVSVSHLFTDPIHLSKQDLRCFIATN